MPDESEENSLDGGVTNAGQRSLPPVDQSIGGGATYAGRQKKSWSDISLGGGSTLGGKLGDQETAIDDGEVADLEARYKVEGTLGRGGMGEVLLALDTRLGRKVAIKRILGEAACSKTAVERFLTEAKSIAAINHPNVVQIYDYGRAKDGPFLIMEYVDGSSLLDHCRDGALPEEVAIDLACQLCDGLGKAHDLGIVHRDIKPANVLLTKDGIPKLTDFGLAKAESADQQMTVTGAVLGTPDFMPPEQRRDASEVDSRSDLWSLAATLYQMVTGRSPKIIRFDLLPASLTSVLGIALEESKGDRFQTAKEFRDALKAGQTAVEPPAADLGEGQCPACGVKNESSRKFCRGCGESLEVPCLSCEKPMPMWEEICGQCGSKQTSLVEQQRGELVALQSEAEHLLKEYRFGEAKNLLKRTLLASIAAKRDPRFASSRLWLENFQNALRDERKALEVRASGYLEQALQHEKAYDYAAGVNALLNINSSIRNEVTDAGGRSVDSVLMRLQNKLNECVALEEKIRSSLRCKNFDEAIAFTRQFLMLKPHDTRLTNLEQKLCLKIQEVKADNEQLLLKAIQHSDAGKHLEAIKVLEEVQDGVRSDKIDAFRSRAELKVKRIAELNELIEKKIMQDDVTALLPSVDELLALQPGRRELRELRERLLLRESEDDALVGEMIERSNIAWSNCNFQKVDELLSKIPKRRQTPEILSRIRDAQGFDQLRRDAIGKLESGLTTGFWEYQQGLTRHRLTDKTFAKRLARNIQEERLRQESEKELLPNDSKSQNSGGAKFRRFVFGAPDLFSSSAFGVAMLSIIFLFPLYALGLGVSNNAVGAGWSLAVWGGAVIAFVAWAKMG